MSGTASEATVITGEVRERTAGPATLTNEEAAAYLGVTGSVLRQMRRDGNGPRCARIGTSIRYRAVDLEAFLDEQLS